MKNNIIYIAGSIAMALAAQSCNNNTDSKNDWVSIDSMANVRMMTTRDSLNMDCNTRAMAMANMQADSMMMAMHKGGKTVVKKTTTTTTNPKDDKMSGKDNVTEKKDDKMSGKQDEKVLDKKNKKMGLPK